MFTVLLLRTETLLKKKTFHNKKPKTMAKIDKILVYYAWYSKEKTVNFSDWQALKFIH